MFCNKYEKSFLNPIMAHLSAHPGVDTGMLITPELRRCWPGSKETMTLM